MTVTTSNIHHNGEARDLIAKWRAQAKLLIRTPVRKSNYLDRVAAQAEAVVMRKCATELRKLVDKL